MRYLFVRSKNEGEIHAGRACGKRRDSEDDICRYLLQLPNSEARLASGRRPAALLETNDENAMAAALQDHFQTASAEFQKLQNDLSVAVDARQKLEAQLSENELVKKVRPSRSTMFVRKRNLRTANP